MHKTLEVFPFSFAAFLSSKPNYDKVCFSVLSTEQNALMWDYAKAYLYVTETGCNRLYLMCSGASFGSQNFTFLQ